MNNTATPTAPQKLFSVSQLGVRDLGPFSLTLASGECLGVSGPSGCGKTTLLRALADLDPSRGVVELAGKLRESVGAPAWRKQVALLPAEPLWWHDHVEPHASDWDAAALRQLGFDTGVLRREVEQLSTGERQRLALCRLLANRPRVLLLDEPTASLDAENVTAVESLLLSYRQANGAAIIWVSHDQAQLARVADRTLTLSSTARDVAA